MQYFKRIYRTFNMQVKYKFCQSFIFDKVMPTYTSIHYNIPRSDIINYLNEHNMEFRI